MRPSTVPAAFAGDGENAGEARENAFIVNEPFVPGAIEDAYKLPNRKFPTAWQRGRAP